MQLADGAGGTECTRQQFDEYATDFLNPFVVPDDVFIAKQILEAEFTGFHFSLGTGMKGTVLGPHLLVESHAIQNVSLYAISTSAVAIGWLGKALTVMRA